MANSSRATYRRPRAARHRPLGIRGLSAPRRPRAPEPSGDGARAGSLPQSRFGDHGRDRPRQHRRRRAQTARRIARFLTLAQPLSPRALARLPGFAEGDGSALIPLADRLSRATKAYPVRWPNVLSGHVTGFCREIRGFLTWPWSIWPSEVAAKERRI